MQGGGGRRQVERFCNFEQCAGVRTEETQDLQCVFRSQCLGHLLQFLEVVIVGKEFQHAGVGNGL